MSRQTEVIESIKRIIRVRRLGVGDKLPSVRALAKELSCGHVTVAQAYKTLEEDGYVQSKRKLGTMIIQDLNGESSSIAYRIVAVQDANGLRSGESYQEQNLFRNGLKQSLGKLELMTIILDSRYDGLEELMDIVCHEHKCRGSNDNTVFMLEHCPKWIKGFFQQEDVHCVVHGGVEPGISIPCVCGDVGATMKKLIDLVDQHDAYPVTFLLDCEPLGMHYYFFEEFKALNDKRMDSSVHGDVLQLSEAEDIFEGQIEQLLDNDRRPRTLVVQNDVTGLKVIRICRGKGIDIPGHVRLISLQTGTIGQSFTPSLSGFYYDQGLSGRHIGDLVKEMLAGQDVKGKRMDVWPVFVSRETFPE